MVKNMFIEVRLCYLTTYVFKEYVKMIKIFMVKFNVSILNRLKIVFFVNTKQIHKHNVILNKRVMKLVTILAKCFFPYLSPTIYIKATCTSDS